MDKNDDVGPTFWIPQNSYQSIGLAETIIFQDDGCSSKRFQRETASESSLLHLKHMMHDSSFAFSEQTIHTSLFSGGTAGDGETTTGFLVRAGVDGDFDALIIVGWWLLQFWLFNFLLVSERSYSGINEKWKMYGRQFKKRSFDLKKNLNWNNWKSTSEPAEEQKPSEEQ